MSSDETQTSLGHAAQQAIAEQAQKRVDHLIEQAKQCIREALDTDGLDANEQHMAALFALITNQDENARRLLGQEYARLYVLKVTSEVGPVRGSRHSGNKRK